MPRPDTPLVSPQLFAHVSQFIESRCTIQTGADTVDPYGGVSTTVWNDAIAGIPCRIAPASGGEVRTAEQAYLMNTFTCVLAGNYPGIVTTQRAVVDGTAYDIKDVGQDDEAIQTRLTLEKVT